MKTINIKGKNYVEVNERIKYFRKEYPDWSLITEIVKLENGFCLIKASAIDDNDNVRATGHAYENENSTFINKTSFIENCETSAVGRCLGILGIGIDTSVASAEEVQNAIVNQDNTKEHIENIKACQSRNDLELYWATLTDKEKHNADILKVFKEIGKKYPKLELVKDEVKGEIKEVQS